MSFDPLRGSSFPIDESSTAGGGGGGLPACAVAGNLLVCNGAAWVAGQANLASSAAVTGTLGVANGGTGLAAVGAANTVLTSTGAVNLYATIVNANVSASAAIAVTKLAPGAANTVLTSDGATNSFATIVNANIAAGALIAVTKLALGAVNTVLSSDGVTNSFSSAPTVVSLAATTFMSIGTTVAAAGLFRLPNAPASGGVVFRNAANSADIIALTVTSGNVTTIAGSGGISLANTTTIASGNLTITSGNITFGSAGAAPVISQTVTTNATAVAMTISAQATSSNGVSTGGALTESAGDATGATGTHVGGAATFRGGDATGASGTRTGGACTIRPGSGATAGGALNLQNGAGTSRVGINDTGLGFFATAPVAQQTITGSRATGAALAALLTQLALTGLIVDGTVA